MGYAEFKAPKGVIKVELETQNGKISRISLSGDFFMYPETSLENLERWLVGAQLQRESILSAVRQFYDATGVSTPMLGPEHWVEAILLAAGKG